MYKFEAFHARVSLLTKFSINSAVMALEEQRAYIKICTLLGATPMDIKADLDTVYGSQAASYLTITRWFLRFKQGRESLEDDPHSGCPLSVFSEDDVTAIKYLLDEYALYTVDEISESLSINSSAVFMILKQRLGLRKICARWVPHLLSQAEKDRRVKITSELLQIYDGCDDKRLCEIVTGDETWISFFEPEGKENNKVWIGENRARPQIAHRSRSVKRVYTYYSLTLEELWPEFQFLNTRLSLVSTTLNKFYLLLLTIIWRRVHELGWGA